MSTESHRNSRRSVARCRLDIEVLEDRLTPSWSSVPPSTITPPTNPVAVTLNSQYDAQGSAAISANEVDYYTFTAPVSGSYRLSTSTPFSRLDTVLAVFSSTGQRLAYNDDISSTNLDSRLSVDLSAGTRYYFGITNYIGSSGGSYAWLVDGPSTTPPPPTDDSYENNDSRSAAYALGTLAAPRTISNLVMADAADWFSFSTAAAGTTASTVSISFLNSQGNLNLELYNGAGQRLRSSSTTGNSESFNLNGLAAGTYYVRVYGASGATNPSYTLNIVPPTSPPPPSGSFDIVIRTAGLTASQQQIFNQAAARWEQIITGDLPNMTYQGVVVDDLLIDARSVFIDGVGGVLGQAGPDAFRSGSRLPYHGEMEFDSADMASMESSGRLYAVVLHEIGHILGFGTIWEDLGLLAGAGTTNPRFLGAQAIAAYNQIFGTNATSVPVEGLPSGPGSRDSHWRESVFGNELMSPYISGSSNPISRVTIASLADLGYIVNLGRADLYTPP